MRALREAAGLFTVIPVRPFDVDGTTATRAMAAFPWLGLLLGAGAGCLTWLTATLISPLLGAVTGFALLAVVTGGLHLDGVADTADGLGSRKPREQALEIMRRSDIGPMGVVTLVFVLLIQVAALATAAPRFAGAALAVSAMASRLAVCVATASKRSARVSGFGALFVGATAPVTVAVNIVLAGVVTVVLGWVSAGWQGTVALAVAGVAAGLVAWGWGRRLARRFGGWTGDTFGSLIEVTQTAFLFVAALAFGVVA